MNDPKDTYIIEDSPNSIQRPPVVAEPPLVVDLDGTLLRTDLLVESFLRTLATQPLHALRVLLWPRGGKAGLKSALALRAAVDVGSLPLNEDLMDLLRTERARGRRLYVASASHYLYAKGLADHLELFDGVFATDGITNLAGEHKARVLVEAFGEAGFDYAGDAAVDMPVWRRARRAYVVNASAAVQRAARQAFPDVEVIGRKRTDVAAYLKALRPHQWVKNVLVFVPMVAAHDLSVPNLLAALAAFVAFCLAASSAYLLNDLLDLPSDRTHATKRHRPFARGSIPLVHGALASPLLAVAALALAASVSWLLLVALCLYQIGTVLYSVFLKQRALIDVITLGGLYTLRVVGGGAAIATLPSPWLLMFSLFLFLSLGIVKRYAELTRARGEKKIWLSGRGYSVDDLPLLSAMAASAGYSAVLVVGLYIGSESVTHLYATPMLLWLICPLLLYWLSRMLLIAHRGHMHDDPVVFAATDHISLITGALCVMIVAAAWMVPLWGGQH